MRILNAILFISLSMFFYACKNQNANEIQSPEMTFYVGTYTNSGSEGIYLCKLDTLTGKLRNTGLVAKLNSPAFLNVSIDDNYLWATQEGVGESDSVVAFQIQPGSNSLTEINRIDVKGGGACYITSTNDINYLGVACYGSGSVSLIPLFSNGEMDTTIFVLKNSGKGINEARQEAPHCHSIRQDANGFVYYTDLGIDKISICKIVDDTLQIVDQIFVAPGSGPRHIDFDPKGKYMAVVNELNNSVELYTKGSKLYYNKKVGYSQTIPAKFDGVSTAADIHFSPDGRFLFVSNRGHESIACFVLERDQDNLKLIEYMRDQVKQPRNFSFDPTGRFLLVANQVKNTISAYNIERETGIPIYNGSTIAIQAPVCIKFLNQYAL